MRNLTNSFGISSLIGWCVFSALARVLTSQISQEISPVILCFYSFLIAGKVFFTLNIRNVNITFRKAKKLDNLKNILKINFYTFGAWFFLIYPLKFIQPTMVSSITMAFVPLATILLTLCIYKDFKTKFSDVMVSALLLGVILFIALLCFFNVTTLMPLPPVKIFYAVFSCIIVGFSTAAGNLYAKKLSNADFSPIEILAFRFFMTITFSGIIALITDDKLVLTYSEFFNVILVAGCLVILPLYLAQVAIKTLDPMIVALTSPFMPVLVLFIELINHQYISKWAILSSVLIFILLLFNAFCHWLSQKKLKLQQNISLQVKHG